MRYLMSIRILTELGRYRLVHPWPPRDQTVLLYEVQSQEHLDDSLLLSLSLLCSPFFPMPALSSVVSVL
jgi:hypothetical protein